MKFKFNEGKKMLEYTGAHRKAVLDREAEWRAQYNVQYDEYNRQDDAFRAARKEVFDAIKEEVINVLPFSSLLDINVEMADYRGNSLQISIEYKQRYYSDSQSLAWEYKVVLHNDGTISKETSSWTGLRATTADQLEDLEKSVMILKKLNSIDWATVLNRALPVRSDYVTAKQPKHQIFDAEKFDAALEDIVGEDIIIMSKDAFIRTFRDKSDWGSCFIIKKLTNKRATFIEIDPAEARKHIEDGTIKDYLTYRNTETKNKDYIRGKVGYYDFVLVDFNGNEVD